MKLTDKYNNLPVQMRASLWFVVCSFLQKAIAALTTPIFTRLMTESEFGDYSVYASWEINISIFVTINLFYGVYTQGLIKFEKEKNIFSSSLQGLTLTMSVIWLAIYIIFRDEVNSIILLPTNLMIAMFISIWANAVYCFWAAEQRVKYAYKALLLVTFIATIAKPALGIILIHYMDDHVAARIYGIVIVEVICYSGPFISQMKSGKQFFSRRFWSYAIWFNIPLIPHYFSQSLLSSADRIMIGRMVSSEAAGIYSLAYAIALIMTIFNTALSQAITPWLLRKIRDKQTEGTSKVILVSLLVVVLVNLGIIICAPEVVAIFAPPPYKDAIWVIPPVTLSVIFVFLYNIYSIVEFYYEKRLFIMIATIIAAILNVLLNYFFISKFGYVAAGYTTLICYIIYAAGHYLFMRRICRENKMSLDFGGMYSFALVVISVVLGLLIMGLYNYIYVRYSIVLIALIIVFVYRKTIISYAQQFISMRKQ